MDDKSKGSQKDIQTSSGQEDKTPLERMMAMLDRASAPNDVRSARIRKLADNIKASLPELNSLLQECKAIWGGEDHFYRFYHHSYKLFRVNELTKNIVAALQRCAPLPESGIESSSGKAPPGMESLNRMFLEIINDAAQRKFSYEINKDWMAATRPVIEAFLHAKFFLELVIKYSDMLSEGRHSGNPGYAAVLSLFNIY